MNTGYHPPTCQHGATVGDCYKCSSDLYIRQHGFPIRGEVEHPPGGCYKCSKQVVEQYDADYFLRGQETGKSLYTDYRWMPDTTIPMVERMVEHLGIIKGETILDFGCARGYVVRAFRELGHDAYGYDSSKWAIENADTVVTHYLTYQSATAFDQRYDWVIAKDVLEHVEYVDSVITNLMHHARKGLFVVVPLSLFNYTPYVIADYEKDVTHKQRMTLPTWAKKFIRPGWSVESSYHVLGIKDNWYRPGWEKGNGFITVRRVEE